jgi:hypothetical protein
MTADIFRQKSIPRTGVLKVENPLAEQGVMEALVILSMAMLSYIHHCEAMVRLLESSSFMKKPISYAC